MKKHYFFLGIAVFVAHIVARSQSFSNGSFEIANDSCVNNIPHSNVQNIIPGVYSFGNSQGIDFRANSCPLPGAVSPPMARNGSKYLLFGYDFSNNGGDSIALQLTSPLVAGQTYVVSYSHRRQSGYTSPIYDIGYSNDSNKFGYLIGLGHCTNFSNSWEDTSYTFTPTISCKYITLRSTLNGELLYLDNFSIKYPVSVKDIAAKEISCYPNPFNDYTILQPGEAALPLQISVTDMAGRILYYRENVDEKEVKISKGDLPAGIYYLQARDHKMQIYHSKLMVY